ncbi:hypothetical protein BCT11_04590 [Vibrio sp. 10N.222.52.B12]|uniref:hypothetical protein n=1 Tax=Vibrio sp. 10N.222.52.B12 TaxID=1880840 RepID=UPI000C8325D5|nr:hypothetical protein [Vibrio sp. 10N.222.52.B12]PMO47177.1 hypothetical protein BCT11_04590 [Vibrio sp. 10N.222.52.B12]
MIFVKRMLFVLLIFLLISSLCVITLELLYNGLSSGNLVKVSPLLAFLGAISALYIWAANVVRLRSDDILKEVGNMYKRSYDTLSGSKNNELPQNDRMLWLTSARLLLSAQDLSLNLTEPSHKKIHKEIEAFWQWKFYLLISSEKNNFPENYFSEGVSHYIAYSKGKSAPIAVPSLIVLYKFFQWKDDGIDRLDNYRTITEPEFEKLQGVPPQVLEIMRKWGVKT